VDMCLKAQINKKPQRRIPLWSKANWDAMKADTVTFCTEFLDSGVSRDVESNWDLLATHLRSIQDKHIPTKLTSTRHNVPWLTSSVKRMCRKKRRLYRRAKKTQEPRHKEAFEIVQSETQKALKKAHWSYVNGILFDGLENGDTITAAHDHFVIMGSCTLMHFQRHAS